MTQTSLLVAALVVSSGVCLSDAFSLPQSTAQPWRASSACFYAPKDSLDDSGPKRRRGRPRKAAKKKTASRRRPRSATVTAATTVADAGDVSTTKKRAPRRTVASKKVTASQKRTYQQSFVNSMLDHELLTKEEEHMLGTQVRRSTQVQETMAGWIANNRARLLQQQEYDRIESVNDSLYNSEEGEEDSPLYGSANSQAMEQYFAEEADEELFYQDGTPFLEGDDDLFGMIGHEFTVFQPQQQQLKPTVPENWMDDILLQDEKDSTSSPTGVLSDEDIRHVLDLPGGRSQLRTILMEGALARNRLIRSNIKLVVSIAKKWVGEMPRQSTGNSLVNIYNGASSITGRPTLAEAVQEGVMGLAEAAERYDPDRGFRFSTYATMWVTNSVRKCFQLESTSGIRLPVPYYDMKRSYINRVRHYLNTEGEVPALEVLAADLGVSEKRLLAALRLTQPLQSIDSAINGGTTQGAADDEYNLASFLACDEPQPEDHVERSLLRQCLENAMATELTPNERDVLRLRLGLDDGVPRTAVDVAEVFGGRFSVPAIRGIEQRAFNKLRSPFAVHTHKLMSYLDFAGIDGGNSLLS